jgi:acetoin utilization deacetylase AcuC-like enzyme
MVVFWNNLAVPPHVDSYSPSWKKPRLFVEALSKAGISHDLQEAAPVTREDLAKVHAGSYVDGMLSGRIANGFDTRDLATAQSLLYTNGIMLEAAKAACEGVSSCAPVSGFHHACYASAGGFCTFNGLALAAK